jgi:hypothetical protein
MMLGGKIEIVGDLWITGTGSIGMGWNSSEKKPQYITPPKLITYKVVTGLWKTAELKFFNGILVGNTFPDEAVSSSGGTTSNDTVLEDALEGSNILSGIIDSLASV